jgi:hypothetical protein
MTLKDFAPFGVTLRIKPGHNSSAISSRPLVGATFVVQALDALFGESLLSTTSSGHFWYPRGSSGGAKSERYHPNSTELALRQFRTLDNSSESWGLTRGY